MDRKRQIETVLTHVIDARVRGEEISDDQVREQHQDLLPELDEELRTLRAIETASEIAAAQPEPDIGSISDVDDLAVLRRLLPHYDIVERLHYGGQGVVYKAIYRDTGRMVAIKVLAAGVFASENLRRRFEREIDAVSRLYHPNIVMLYDSGVIEGRRYFAMEYVEGAPIDEYVALQCPSAAERIRLFIKVCHAVHYAHQRCILHRDLKPTNILVDLEGEPHLVDFGLAKEMRPIPLAEAGGAPHTVHFVGTLPYASPEQIAGPVDGVDIRSDVYTLGVVLYQMLTARLPFAMPSTLDRVCLSILNDDPVSLRRAAAADTTGEAVGPHELDGDVQAIVDRALAKEPERRYQSALDLAEDLERYLAGELVEARAHVRGYQARKLLRRYRWPVACAAVLLLLAGGLAGVYMQLTLQKRAAVATGELQSSRARAVSADTLVTMLMPERWQARRAELQLMPAEYVAEEHRRYERPVSARSALPPLQWTSDIATPDDFYASYQQCRSGLIPEGLTVFLDANASLLDEVRNTHARSCLEFPLQDPKFPLTGEDLRTIRLAAVYARLYLVRVIVQSSAVTGDAGVEDLWASRRIALDLGDNVSDAAWSASIVIRSEIYSHATNLLYEHITTEGHSASIVAWVLADPKVREVSSAVAFYKWRKMHWLAQYTKSDAEGTDYLDALQLESQYPECFAAMAKVCDSPREWILQVSPAEAEQRLNAYFQPLMQWDSLPYSGLARAVDARIEFFHDAHKADPISYFYPWLEPRYFTVLRVEAMRRALRICAAAVKYRQDRGAWPGDLASAADCLLPTDLIDPLANTPFDLEVVDGLPRVSSRAVSLHRQDGLGRSMPITTIGDRLVYFPPPGGLVTGPQLPN